MAITKTSPLKTSSSNSLQRGFTLIEILVVMGILAAVLAIGLPKLTKGQNNIKKVMRELAILGKEVRNQARLKNMTHRIVFEMGETTGSYWIEAAQGPVPAKKASEESPTNDDEKKDNELKSPFQKSERFFKGVRKLPADLRIKRVETATNPQGKTQGLAYVYFTPEGLVEKSVIQLGNTKDLTWSLIYNPLTGHADIVEKAMSLKDIDNQ